MLSREELIDRIKKEKLAFEAMKDDLLLNEELKGKFVAVFKGEIVDFDKDERKLVKRIFEKYGYAPIYIQKVEKEIPVEEIPTPFLCKEG